MHALHVMAETPRLPQARSEHVHRPSKLPFLPMLGTSQPNHTLVRIRNRALEDCNKAFSMVTKQDRGGEE